MIFINLMLVMISFTHVFKVFNNISASSWAKTWKRFQIENRLWLEMVGFGSVNLLTTALVQGSESLKQISQNPPCNITSTRNSICTCRFYCEIRKLICSQNSQLSIKWVLCDMCSNIILYRSVDVCIWGYEAACLLFKTMSSQCCIIHVVINSS